MSIVIEDASMQRLAEELAGAKGVTVAEVIREGLLSLAARRKAAAVKPPLRERLAALAREVDAIPPREPADMRSDEEILGYNEHGAW